SLGQVSQMLGVQRITVGPSMYNVKSDQFGATGGGTATDSAAINAAVSAASGAGGGGVYFPQGTYPGTSSIVPASNVRLRGAGPGPSIILGAPDVTVINGTSLTEISLMDLQIQVQTNLGTPNGIVLTGGSKILIQNVEVANAWDSIDLL